MCENGSYVCEIMERIWNWIRRSFSTDPLSGEPKFCMEARVVKNGVSKVVLVD